MEWLLYFSLFWWEVTKLQVFALVKMIHKHFRPRLHWNSCFIKNRLSWHITVLFLSQCKTFLINSMCLSHCKCIQCNGLMKNVLSICILVMATTDNLYLHALLNPSVSIAHLLCVWPCLKCPLKSDSYALSNIAPKGSHGPEKLQCVLESQTKAL